LSGRLTFDEAVAALARGDVVALPTDTVYGIGSALDSPRGVDALFVLKDRPVTTALPVVAASRASLDNLVIAWPDGADRLSRLFWPGALTVVVGATEQLCALVHSPSSRVGFRVPDDPALASILRVSGPLALTSANAHGGAPCASADEVIDCFAGRDELVGVYDAGRRDGVVSTVVDFDDDGWRVVREGAFTHAQIAAALA
jgi:L-threonylcarbamoyladenylate synthase